MDARLQIILVVGILVFATLLLYNLVKKRLHLKYCLVWILAIFAMLFAAIFPNVIKWIAKMLGIKTPSNFIFVVYGFFVVLIIFSLTAIVSHMNERIFRLVQNQALLEQRLRNIENEIEGDKVFEDRNSNISRDK